MNDSQIKQFPMCSPQAFEAWVRDVATINEQFSEVLHNSADILAVNDPEAAMGLYQAAEAAHATVHHLRMSVPKAGPIVPPVVKPSPHWIGFAFLCGYLLSLI